MQKRRSEKSEITAMTSCCVVCVCGVRVCIFVIYQIVTYRQWFDPQSCGQRKKGPSGWLCFCSGQSRPPHQPFTPECFTLSVLILLHLRLFAQNHIHDQTWPDPIKVKPSDTSATGAEKQKKPILLLTVSGWRRLQIDVIRVL